MKSFNEKVEHLNNTQGREALLGMLRGIEREALRIDDNGHLAQDEHPKALGSALTNPRITTDYSEALLEFITPVNHSIDDLLEGLTQTHAYTVRNLNGQKLWPVSMPCYVGDVANIPVARYGNSNTGKMKTLYRTGLTHRYGALMQIIAGVHFNFSVSNELWQRLYDDKMANGNGNACCSKSITFEDFISESYFGLIRNYRRLVWVLPYLFGSSPALCGSFIKDQDVDFEFEKTGKGTLYLPYATSLRMSDLGYTNKEQDTLNISYNSLPEYLEGVGAAIKMPSKKFAQIGVNVDGDYRQLNSNILQIENEFYAPIRAKRVTKSGEKPSQALARAGVEYIEVRALDVNPFSPVGIDATQVRFLDLFLLHCLLSPSKDTDEAGEAEIAANLKAVVLEGRKPGLTLQRDGQTIGLKEWMHELFAELSTLAVLLDGEDSHAYQIALNTWAEAIDEPDKTLSGRVIHEVVVKGTDHSVWVHQLAKDYHEFLNHYPLSDETEQCYADEAKASLAEQQKIEQQPQDTFSEFLKQYFKDVVPAGTFEAK
ncbi:glutamate--cysteine ligase [Shewanella metallivivens]|uniref:Glutamate--cysteine ligase n=1 Tax=Shewanella metallivivens TaxID=2872342 RepID=A0ABT5TJG0_9GAMM|nr:glutamate--cysteine ligase [Shewanella metallivivens]MDD8058736.1 glutamate--cysteine ligase [Shewanella metallivivens]